MSEEGAQTERMTCLWSALRCSMRVWWCCKFFFCKNLQSHSRCNYKTVTSSVTEPANTWQGWGNQSWGNQRETGEEWRMRARFLPLKEMKTRGAASGSLLNEFPRARPDSARMARTVRSMVEQPPTATRSSSFKVSARGGEAETRGKKVSQHYAGRTLNHNKSVFVYSFMWHVK